MKKFLLVLVMLSFGFGSVMAQSEEVADAKHTKRNEKMYLKYNKVWNKTKGYINLAYANQSLSDVDSDASYDADWAAAISWGRTFYLHKKPLARMMKFGLDWSWLDINAGQYSYVDSELFKERERYDLFQAEVGMQVGPSFTINPVHHLKLSVYYRLTPSYAAMYDMEGEAFHGNFGLFTNMGAAISWKFISLGIEKRSGKVKYNDLEFGKFGYDDTGNSNPKLKTETVRFYLGFRF